MAAEDRHEEVFTDEECIDCTERERSFDTLTRGLANGSISRRKALRVLGASLVGSVLAAIPGVALAKPPTGTCLKENKPCKTNTDCCSQNCETRKGKLVCGPAVQCTGSGQGNCPQPANQCLQVLCSASGVCGAAQAKPNGTGCNDDDPCTVNDTCQGGTCTPGGPKDCSDNDICTTDTCNPVTGVCEHSEIPGCCRTPADCPTPTNQCQQATCTAGVCGVENKPDNTECDDNNSCTENDVCTGGLCAGTRISGCVNCTNDNDCSEVAVTQCQEAFCQANNACGVRNKDDGTSCEDGNPCTVNDTCQAGLCVTGTPKDCSDNDICTTDTCNPVTGACEHTAVPNCCHTAADCPTPADQCQRATCVNNVCGTEVDVGKSCNDDDPCTVNDTCTAAGTCVGTPKDCSDNDICTTDTCNPVTGACEHTAVPNCCHTAADCPTPADQCQRATCVNNVCGTEVDVGKSCNDDDPCTVNDTCTAAGTCVGTPKDCSDNDICTTDTCNPVTGVCEHSEIPGCCRTPADCPTPTNQCQQATCTAGVCGVENKPDNTECDDNNSCTENDVCTGGLCAGTRISGCVNCTNDNDCSEVAVTQCQEAFCQANNTCGVRNKDDGTSCEDGNPCTVNDTCQAGLCVTGTPKDCSDNDICTTDTCNPMTGACEHTPVANCCTTDAQCNDNDPCTTDTCNQTTHTCVHTPVANCCTTDAQCNDNNVCTTDTCVNNVCVHTPTNQGGRCAGNPANPRRCCNGICCANTGACTAITGTCPP